MNINFSFDKSSLIKLVKSLETKQERIRNTKPPLAIVATLMYKSVMQNFQEEGTDKEKWQPLSAMTIAMRRKGKRAGGKPKILQDTGTLRRSIFPTYTNDEAIVSTNIPYAKIHQFGGTIRIPERTIRPKKASVLRFMVDNKIIFAKYIHQPAREAEVPARPFMVLREKHKEMIVNVLKRWIYGKD